MKLTWKLPIVAVLLTAVLGVSPIARSQPAPTLALAALTGTLAKVHEGGTITIGYRESPVPFSYLSSLNEPIGFSIELCRALVASIEEAAHKSLEIKWALVTTASRIDAVVSGLVDLECGSTTNNVERQKQVSFSPTIFVSCTKLLVEKGSPITGFRDLAGKRVAATRGTTNENTTRDLSQKITLKENLIAMLDHAEAFAQVVAGQVDAFASGDVLLYGLIDQNKGKVPGDYQVVGDFLSYNPYGVMNRKGDAQLAKLVNLSFQTLAIDGEVERWFLGELPLSNTSINLPMSPRLETIIQTFAVRNE